MNKKNKIILIFSLASLIGLASFFTYFNIILKPDFEKVKALSDFKPNITTKIYDQNNILISELFRQKREVVPLEKIPVDLVNAFIALEDNEFYNHFGVNPKGIVRAFFINIFAGGIKQGGSTITQQLAKILLTSRQRNLYRKIKEAFLAIILEFNLPKEKILSLYLNQIFLGHGAYGVESASKLYFNKHVWELNLAEASLIATLPAAPNRFSPIRHPKKSMQRHKVALAKMVQMGFTTIPKAEESYSQFWSNYLDFLQEIPPTLNTWNSKVDKAPWFTEYIRQKLVAQFGEKKVYEDGLQVYTTLDLKKQLLAQKKIKSALQKQTKVSFNLSFKNEDYFIDNYLEPIILFSDLFGLNSLQNKGSRQQKKINEYFCHNISEELEGLNLLTGHESLAHFLNKYKKTYNKEKDMQKVEGALVSIDHRTGYIEALVGGSEFNTINQLNRALMAKRQTGSAIKPFLYASAFASGHFTPASTMLDSPLIYLDPEGDDWLPENYGGQYFGLVRLHEALIKSINIISIKIADKLKIDYVANYYAKVLKFNEKENRERIPRNFSISLGSFEVTPFELTRAYAIIANQGKEVIPFAIRYIKSREDKIIDQPENEINQILKKKEEDGSIYIMDKGVAQIMTNLLKDVVEKGTGKAAALDRPAAGKTGTTNNWRDAWFCGFTSTLTTGVWVGYDKMNLSLGIGQAGGRVAAPLWGSYMQEALQGEADENFNPLNLLVEKEICAKSGLLASSDCKDVLKEYFLEDTWPDQECQSCEDKSKYFNPLDKGPKDNISLKQKKKIWETIKNNKDSLLDHLDNDLRDDTDKSSKDIDEIEK